MSRPFDEARYKTLLDGLEVTVLKFSEMDLGSRIDAEYFSKENLTVQNTLKQKQARKFAEYGKFVSSAFYPAATHLYATGVVPFIRCVDCVNYPVISKLQDESFERIPLEFLEEHDSVHRLDKGEIVITKVGTPCYASIVHEHDFVALSRTVFGVKNIIGIDPYYLVAFLRSRYGFQQLQRERELTIQFQLTLDRVRDILIFEPSKEFQKKVGQILKLSFAKLEASKSLYAQAEATLLDELGLKNWKPPKESAAVKSFSESFGKSGRLDAEFYQPKYDKLFAHLRKTGQAIRLGDWVREPIKRGTQPEYSDDGEILVINSQHVGKTEVELENNSYTTKEFAKENERAVVRKYDVLLNSTGYITIGRCQTLLEDITAVVDGHVAIIRPKEGLDPIFLGLYLNALPGQLQTEQGWTGSSGQIELRRDIVENYVVWKPDMKIQTRIHKLVENAYNAEQESKRLLELSKRAVEVAIEKGESKGMKVLE